MCFSDFCSLFCLFWLIKTLTFYLTILRNSCVKNKIVFFVLFCVWKRDVSCATTVDPLIEILRDIMLMRPANGLLSDWTNLLLLRSSEIKLVRSSNGLLSKLTNWLLLKLRAVKLLSPVNGLLSILTNSLLLRSSAFKNIRNYHLLKEFF